MATISINSLPSAVTIEDTDKFIISGFERTGAQVLAFIEGDTSIIHGTDKIVKTNANSGRGVEVTMTQFAAFVNGDNSQVSDGDFFLMRRSGALYKVVGTLVQSYLLVVPEFSLIDSDGEVLIDSDEEPLLYQ